MNSVFTGIKEMNNYPDRLEKEPFSPFPSYSLFYFTMSKFKIFQS